jgi:hypothetical protein
MTKTEARLEVAFDILQKIHSDLCHNRKIEEAKELQDVMRRVILFSEKI